MLTNSKVVVRSLGLGALLVSSLMLKPAVSLANADTCGFSELFDVAMIATITLAPTGSALLTSHANGVGCSIELKQLRSDAQLALLGGEVTSTLQSVIEHAQKQKPELSIDEILTALATQE